MPRSRKPSELHGCVGATPTPSATFLTLNERQNHETCHPLPKSVALSQELQTETHPPNPPVVEANHGVSASEPVRRETAINTRPLAQKQSARLITGRPRSVTVEDDQPSLCELRLGKPASLCELRLGKPASLCELRLGKPASPAATARQASLRSASYGLASQLRYLSFGSARRFP